jgi:hypothetical protein
MLFVQRNYQTLKQVIQSVQKTPIIITQETYPRVDDVIYLTIQNSDHVISGHSARRLSLKAGQCEPKDDKCIIRWRSVTVTFGSTYVVSLYQFTFKGGDEIMASPTVGKNLGGEIVVELDSNQPTDGKMKPKFGLLGHQNSY